MGGIVIKDKDTSYALQRLAREQMILRLLGDILFDLQVCKLEHWDCHEYVKRLKDELNRLDL